MALGLCHRPDPTPPPGSPPELVSPSDPAGLSTWTAQSDLRVFSPENQGQGWATARLTEGSPEAPVVLTREQRGGGRHVAWRGGWALQGDGPGSDSELSHHNLPGLGEVAHRSEPVSPSVKWDHSRWEGHEGKMEASPARPQRMGLKRRLHGAALGSMLSQAGLLPPRPMSRVVPGVGVEQAPGPGSPSTG